MPVIEWKKEDGVAVLVMDNGENRHNPEFVSAMLNALDEIERDPENISASQNYLAEFYLCDYPIR